MAPANYRGAFTTSFEFCVGIGILLANLINYGAAKIKGGWGWRISLAMAAVPASLLVAGAVFLPESPNCLIQYGENNHAKAKRVLQRIRGTEDVKAELDDLINASDFAKTVKHPFKEIIKKKYRPQLVMSIAIPVYQHLTGVNVITFYAPILSRTIGFGESASLIAAVASGVVGTVTILFSAWAVDRLGRRLLFQAGGIIMFVSQILIGSIMAAKLGDHGGLTKGYGLLVLILFCIYMVGFCLSWGPLGWLIPSEIYSLEIRSAAQSITVAVGFLFTFLVAQSFLPMLCHLKAGIFFFYGGWIVVMTVFVYFLLPETKNVPLEKMDQLWKEHWFWKGIVVDAENHA